MRRATHSLALALILSASGQAVACINAFGTDRDGHKFSSQHLTGEALARVLTLDAKQQYWVADVSQYRDRALNQPSYENAINFGVALLYQGHRAPAIGLFLDLEKAFPGRSETAANLGTALELAGHDAVALRWIRIGMRRDVTEHDGTEWLHARILEAKIADAAGRGDRSRSIAGVAFDNGVVPALPKVLPSGNDGKPIRLHELDRALRYQLEERMAFVPPKDWVVANLLSDWASLNLAGGPLESAKALHGLALRYGEPQSLLWSRRVAHIDKVLAKAKQAPSGQFDCPICEPPPPPPPPPPRAG